MRQLLLSATFLLSTLTVLAQTSFNHLYNTGSAGSVFVEGATVDPDINYLLLMERDDKINLLKTDGDGTPLWSKEFDFGIDQGLYGSSVAANDSVYLIGGFIIGAGTQSRDGFLIWLDHSGTILHQQKVDVNGNSNAVHTIEATSDGFIVSGRVDSPSSYEMLLSKYDDAGNHIWSRSYGSSDWDWGQHAIETNDGGYAIVGYADGFGGGFSDAFFVKTDQNGAVEFEYTLETSSADEFSFIQQSDSGHYFLAGLSLNAQTSGFGSAIITRVDQNGNLEWSTALDEFYEVDKLRITSDGGVMFVTTAAGEYSGSFGGWDVVFGKMSSSGELLWTRVVGSTANETAEHILAIGADDYALVGGSTDGGLPNFQPYIFDLTASLTADCQDSAVVLIDTLQNFTYGTVSSTYDPLTNAVSHTTTSVTVNNLSIPSVINSCCGTPLAAGFTYDQPANDTIYSFDFTSTTTGNGQITWTFGDGNTASGPNVSHTYVTQGTYEVCQTIQNSCDADSTCQTFVISCTAPMADFTWGLNGNDVIFSNQSTGATSYFWDFGDGNSSTSSGPSHTFDWSASSTYNVCLTAYNMCDSSIACEVVVNESEEPNGLDEWTNSAIRLYPNPVPADAAMLFIEAPEHSEFKGTFTMTGQRLDLSVENDGTITTLQTSDLEAGVYFVQFNHQGATYIQRFIKH